MPLSAAQIGDYRNDGFLCPLSALTSDSADRYRDQFLAFEKSDLAKSAADLHKDIYLFKPYLILKWVDELVHEPGLLDLAESLIGPNIMCWSAGIFQKAPRSPNYVSWHQDAVYYGLSPVDHVVRVWVALSSARVENGTLLYVRGAHKEGLLPHDPTEADDNLLVNNETVRFDADAYEQVPVILDPGEVAIHHLHMPHASGANRSDEWRINLVITYLSPDVRQDHGPDSALLVRGRDDFGNFEPESRPDADFSPSARERHRRAMDLRRGIFATAAAKYAAAEKQP